jgi:hypothetical protein
LFALAVLALGAACGGGGDDATPFEVVSSARAKTLAEDSSKIALTIESTGNALTGGQPLKITADGAYDFAERLGALTMDLSALGLPGASGKVEMVLTSDVFYMKFPSSLSVGSKPWLKLDLNTLGEQSGIDLTGLQQVGGSDPTSALNYLEGVAQDGVTEVGKAEVRGEDTTHYRMTVDLERAKADVREDLRDDYDKIIDQLGRSTFPAELWVDADDRVRRMRFRLDPGDNGDVPPVTITQELYDFGADVEATPPPADQVSDFSELLRGLGGG